MHHGRVEGGCCSALRWEEENRTSWRSQPKSPYGSRARMPLWAWWRAVSLCTAPWMVRPTGRVSPVLTSQAQGSESTDSLGTWNLGTSVALELVAPAMDVMLPARWGPELGSEGNSLTPSTIPCQGAYYSSGWRPGLVGPRAAPLWIPCLGPLLHRPAGMDRGEGSKGWEGMD